MILENIHTPADVKALDREQLEPLCRELRQFLVEHVSKTGGHLASNLGAVELTVAIHRVFDTRQDRLVFDVGHQCYCHKILTGRREAMATLRQYGGIAGFPKPVESVHDAFIAGHASNSVAVALGMVRARQALGEHYKVMALIGDGALTGGLAYEGLSNAGACGQQLLVILNDNGMSITTNVGAVADHLARQRLKPQYLTFKRYYRRVMNSGKIGRKVYRFTHKVKQALKQSLLPCSMFENMGFNYVGPVNGHDLTGLTRALRYARELNEPVLLHVKTVKGKGYAPAEENPDAFHGVSPFDPATGKSKKKSGENFSAVFGRTLTQLAQQDRRVCAITAAMADGTGLAPFAKEFPDRFFDVAIAEGHGVAMAAGLAKQGMLPVFAVYSSFLQRGYDMLIHDVALQRLHVVLGVDRAGLVGADGETHHGCFDALFLSEIPGFTVLCPASFAELRRMLRQALFEIDGPVAVRYPRGGEGDYREDRSGAPVVRLREGEDVTLLTYGVLVNQALAAADLLERQGVRTEVLKLNQISPLEYETLAPWLAGKKLLAVAEDAFGAGCVGQRTAAILAQHGQAPEKLVLINLGKTFLPEGTVPQLEHQAGIDAAGIARAVQEART